MNAHSGTRSVELTAGPGVEAETREEALAEVTRRLDRVVHPVDRIRLRLTWLPAPGLAHRALAQVNLELAGVPARVQVAAPTLPSAVRALGARLSIQVAAALAPPAPRPWPDGRGRPEPVSTSGDGGRIIRHKAVSLESCSPTTAALTMDRLDHSIHLFVDADTGVESVVRRVGPTGYRLTRLAGLAPPSAVAGSVSVPMTVDVHPVPTRTLDQIARRLDIAELDHRFFRDAQTGRGAVLYRRYDGGLALLTGTVGG